MRARSRFAVAVGNLGAYRLALRATERLPRVLMYHRFSRNPSPRRLHASEFERQLRILKRQFRVVPLGEYGEWLAEGRPVPARTAIITVDDGYRDFYEVAYPLLRKYDLPATLFVATDPVDNGAWLWPDVVQYVLETTSRPVVSLELGSEVAHLPVSDPEARAKAWACVVDAATAGSNDERLQLLRKLADGAAVIVPDRATEEFAVSTWAELEEMSRNGIEIGGHTRSHPVLSRIPPSDLRAEIGGCKSRIEERIGIVARSFCYPNGMPRDISDAARSAVVEAGFLCAVSAYVSYQGSLDRFCIERMAVGAAPRYFNEAVFGVDSIRARLRSRSRA